MPRLDVPLRPMRHALLVVRGYGGSADQQSTVISSMPAAPIAVPGKMHRAALREQIRDYRFLRA